MPSFPQQLASVNMRSASQEAQPLKRGSVTQVVWLEVIGLLEEVVSLFVILLGLRFPAFVVQDLGLVGGHGDRYYC